MGPSAESATVSVDIRQWPLVDQREPGRGGWTKERYTPSPHSGRSQPLEDKALAALRGESYCAISGAFIIAIDTTNAAIGCRISDSDRLCDRISASRRRLLHAGTGRVDFLTQTRSNTNTAASAKEDDLAKVAIIGAGSIVFCKTLILDILATQRAGRHRVCTDGAQHASDTTRGGVRQACYRGERPAGKGVDDHGSAGGGSGADYVIATFQVGGLQGFESDYSIPLQYGVDQCIGDTLGPGGIFRALRSIPVMMDLAADMEELCPDAHLLNTSIPWPWCAGRWARRT